MWKIDLHLVWLISKFWVLYGFALAVDRVHPLCVLLSDCVIMLVPRASASNSHPQQHTSTTDRLDQLHYVRDQAKFPSHVLHIRQMNVLCCGTRGPKKRDAT